MSKPLLIDLFAEDRAHEEWLRPLLARLAREHDKEMRLRVRSARGGHGRAISELKLYQTGMEKGVPSTLPDLLVIAIDANCTSFAGAQKSVQDALTDPFKAIAINATPDPHIEMWYLADQKAFHDVVGRTPTVPRDKCERDYYKKILAQSVIEAGHPPTLGGIEFAQELVDALDFFRAGKADNSFKHFLEEATACFKRH
jgi:hypothetical protein